MSDITHVEAIPNQILAMLEVADPSWQPTLKRGLQAMVDANPGYFSMLLQNEFLPTRGRLFAAFGQPIQLVRYVLVGEGPYPREASATGMCFMDGLVESLWSPTGLSKAVNRATSLRNFMKMLLVADGQLSPACTTADALAEVSRAAIANASSVIQTLPQLQNQLLRKGFLLLNATLVFRPHIPPIYEARAWQPFFQSVLSSLSDQANNAKAPTLVLWGKVAAQVNQLPAAERLPKIVTEHPYNLSFIKNEAMHALFGPMRLLHHDI